MYVLFLEEEVETMGFMPDYVNNEVFFCKTKDLEIKKKIETVLLKYRISYFVDSKNKLFMDKNDRFIFKINRASIEQANEVIKELDCYDSILFTNSKK